MDTTEGNLVKTYTYLITISYRTRRGAYYKSTMCGDGVFSTDDDVRREEIVALAEKRRRAVRGHTIVDFYQSERA